tara:strand:+ start:23 stop:619 length:597 start_codon:yes stop_codon:yes gene_type:complete
MSKQIVNIIEFSKLFDILREVNHLFKFEMFNYENYKDFIEKFQPNITQNSLIIFKKDNRTLLQKKDLIKNEILIFDTLPLSLEKILDQINISLIKQKYYSQSKCVINSYNLDLNSKIFSDKNHKLKLTEKETEIILFLNKDKRAKNIITLQNEIWGYSAELDTHTVETHIYRLRKKIKDTFNDNNFIMNSKDGYTIKN